MNKLVNLISIFAILSIALSVVVFFVNIQTKNIVINRMSIVLGCVGIIVLMFIQAYKTLIRNT